MSNGEFIVSLDLGTSQVRVIVAELNPDGTTQIIGVGTAESEGIKKGAIINIDQAVHSICLAVENAEQMVGIEISEVYVGISGNQVSLQTSHGVVAVSSEDREIGYQDIDRVLHASRVIPLPPERDIIEVVPKQFIVDGLTDIRDPNGMIGVRLEVEAIIVTGAKTTINNLLRSVEKASLDVVGQVYLPLGCSELSLTEDEKNLGVVMVDIGGGTTALTVYQQGHLVGTAVLPIGGEYITNDIAFGLRVTTDHAEEIKCKYGNASCEHVSDKDKLPVRMIGANEEKKIYKAELAMIIEPRVTEMFQLIRQQVQEMGFSVEPAGGYVLTGGVMATQGIIHVAKKQLGNVVRIASPNNIGVKEPSYAGGVGIIHYLHKRGMLRVMKTVKQKPRPKKKRGLSPFERVKSWLNEFI